MYNRDTNRDMIKRATKIINCLNEVDTICKDDIVNCIDYLGDLIGYFNHLDISENLLPKEDRVEVPEEDDSFSDYLDYIDSINHDLIRRSNTPVAEERNWDLEEFLKKAKTPNIQTYLDNYTTQTTTLS